MVRTSTWIRLFLVLLCCFGAAAFLLAQQQTEGCIARIEQNGRVIRTVDLRGVTAPYELVLEAEDGGYNTVQVSPGSIAVIAADCPDGICVAHGAISKSGDPIVCLPHRLIITIEAAEKDAVDSVSQ